MKYLKPRRYGVAFYLNILWHFIKEVNLSNNHMEKFYLLVILVFIIGCDESPKSITSKNPYAKFTVKYDVVTNNSEAFAFFWKNSNNEGSYYLDKDEELYFQDKSMAYHSGNKGYSINIAGYSAKNTFKLVDLKKNEFVNAIVGNNISFPMDVQFNRDTINTSIPIIFKWEGNPVDTNETITLSIEEKLFKQDTLAATSITIPTEGIQQFNGKSVLTELERHKETELQQKVGSGGLITYLYKAAPRKLIFKEGALPLTNKNIYAEFTTIYDAATNISTGSVQLWENNKSGPELFIDKNSTLKYQNISMHLETGTNRYSSNFNDYATLYEFGFIDVDKKEYRNTITSNRISLPVSLADTINTSEPLKISWTENGISVSEKVILRIQNKNIIQDTLNAKNITILTPELSSFKGTSQTITIERHKETGLQAKLGANGSGFISNRYIAQSKTVFFK